MTTRFVPLILSLVVAAAARGNSNDLGHGFLDHGVCAPISQHRGTVATSDGSHDLVLSWLMDHRGGYELLMVDVDTGKSTDFKVPFNFAGDSPYASILSRAGKFYTHYAGHFIEFDPVARAFTFNEKTTGSAMAMTQDDRGLIWSVSYPNCGVVSFDPRTRKLRDFGSIYKQNWPIYPRGIAADDSEWIYVALGNVASQLVALDPASGKARPILNESQRRRGMASVYRDLDGKVYGQPLDGQAWWHLYRGEAREMGNDHSPRPKKFVAGSQSLFYADFPDGKKLKIFDLERRHLVIERADKRTKDVHFDYDSDGAMVMGAIASPTGAITGATTYPQRCFTYNPRTDTLTSRTAFRQWNAFGRSGLAVDHHIFIAAYPGGYFLDWDTDQPWVDTDPQKGVGNPLSVTDGGHDIYRPACVLPLRDGKTVIVGGTPGYGYTGGGLLFWNRLSHEKLLLSDQQVLANQSTVSLAALDDERILGGTTTAAGSGGEKKAKRAELYILDLKDHRVHWHEAVIPGAQSYAALRRAGDVVLGVADKRTFFVFDPVKRQVTQRRDFGKEFGNAVGQQGPRPFVTGPNGEIYLLTTRGIVGVEKGTWNLKLLAKSPVPIAVGGDYLGGRIYFISGSHLCSWALDQKQNMSVK